MVLIGTGNICNNNCIMCTGIMPSPLKNPILSTSEILNQIKNGAANEEAFSFTGGEPTLREDLFEMFDYVNQNYPKSEIHLITNGRRLAYNDYINKMRRFKRLEIITELHGDEGTHDFITGVPGSYKETVEGIKNALKLGFEVELRIVISKINYKKVPVIATIYKEEFPDAERVVLFPIDLIGNAFKNKNKVLVTYKEIVPFMYDAIDILSNGKAKVSLYHTPYCVLDEKYWKYVEGVTVPERRVTFAEICGGCKFMDKCPRVWKTYAKIVGLEEFRAIRNGSA